MEPATKANMFPASIVKVYRNRFRFIYYVCFILNEIGTMCDVSTIHVVGVS